MKASLIVVMVLAAVCTGLPAANAVVVPILWTSPTGSTLYSVFMLSASDGWAVGAGTIIRWDGTNWSTMTSPTANWLLSVFMVGSDDGWAVGANGAMISWDGTSWTTVTSPTTNWLYAVYMVGSTDGWAVGYAGTIIRWTGTVWVPEFPPLILVPLLISLTLVVVILAKTASKKQKTN